MFMSMIKSQLANKIICYTIEHKEFKFGGRVSLKLPSRHSFHTSTGPQALLETSIVFRTMRSNCMRELTLGPIRASANEHESLSNLLLFTAIKAKRFLVSRFESVLHLRKPTNALWTMELHLNCG